MTVLQTLIFAIMQGITELFPISSVAYDVIVPYIFHWNLEPSFLHEHFLSYVVMLHLGTGIALFSFFWREWFTIIWSLFVGRKKTLLLLIIATIPAGIIGIVFERPLTYMFSNVTSAAFFLILNGFFLYFGEKMRTKGEKTIEDMNIFQAFFIGIFQTLAFIPGFSRTGSSMIAGFWTGLKYESAARFSMLIATPVIIGASLFEISVMKNNNTIKMLHTSLLGGLIAGILAYTSIWIIMKWFKRKEIQHMRPFAFYCWIVGGLVLISQFA